MRTIEKKERGRFILGSVEKKTQLREKIGEHL